MCSGKPTYLYVTPSPKSVIQSDFAALKARVSSLWNHPTQQAPSPQTFASSAGTPSPATPTTTKSSEYQNVATHSTKTVS
ncbi:hypothetical protein TRICI_006804 [Trichomonascus ciferrii]|uniref:Uncharacterized protein n=1 Tax=Trichomonascus ciferrii TaxID=44093 RepID=A0A642UDA5_9ASCO|nr:hypothetical protein TRICI_006804 [Trichomonascus ciferrii]